MIAALLLLFAGPLPVAAGPLVAGPPGEEVEISCDTISYEARKEVVRLDGNVVVRRGAGVVHAKAGVWDRAAGKLLLSGGVLAVQERQVFLADAALVDLVAHSADLTSAVLYLKEKPASEAAPTAGANALVLRGQRLRQEEHGVVVAERVRLTPCDCATRPDYELLAKSARIEGDRAHLSGVDLALFGVELPLFPLSLPLSRRQWGLLAPQLGFGGAKGFAFAQPVFAPLGESFDLTFTPGLFTGRHAGQSAADPTQRALAGPRLGTEFRYAPWEGTLGSLSLDLVDDLHAHDSHGSAPGFPGESGVAPGRGFGGLRGTARFSHRTEGARATFAVDGSAVSDAGIAIDQAPNSPERFVDFRRTDAGLWGDSGPLSLGIGSTFLQDLRVPVGTDLDRRLVGGEARSTFQRLPSPFIRLAPVMLGGVTASAEASAASFAPFRAPGPEERQTGFGPTDSSYGAPPVRGSSLERATATRFDGAARLGWAPAFAGPVSLQLSAGGRGDAWLFESDSTRNATRLYGTAAASAALPLERSFGDVLHRIEPAVSLVALTRSLRGGGAPIGDPADGGGTTWASRPDAAQQPLPPFLRRRTAASPGVPGAEFLCDSRFPDDCVAGVPAARRGYDEIDGAAPSSGELEGILGLRQSLWRASNGHAVRTLRLDLTQDVLLWTRGGQGRLGEAAGILEGSLGRFGAQLHGRYDWSRGVVTSWGAGAATSDARGDFFQAGVGASRANTSSEALLAGLDELFSAPRLDAVAGPFSGIARFEVAGVAPGLQFLRLHYVLQHHLEQQPPDYGQQQHNLDLSLESSCHCARVVLSLGHATRDFVRPVGGLQFNFLLDLKSLGSLSTF